MRLGTAAAAVEVAFVGPVLFAAAVKMRPAAWEVFAEADRMTRFAALLQRSMA
jgi:hypothetical protein